MIDTTVLPLFFVTTIFLAISPGPDLVLISTYSSTRGFKNGLMVSLGIFIAGLIQTLLVAFGLGKLLQAIPLLVLAIKIVGAIYLSWLGLNLLRRWLKNNKDVSASQTIQYLGNKELIYLGLINNIMNPKALLFFSMFLPQFTHSDSPLTNQILILGTILSFIVLCINTIFSMSFSKLGSLLGRNLRLNRHIDGMLGVVFLVLASRLATSK
ncbi:LysE family translocator [Vibrio sp. Of14-4]|uniref:LysE family translocator n=1 Tax=Vibrio sp. Of14-4 TaxID=2724878 RepID=UPI001EF311E5|nr:LysE family translocator [Vibrio sp. Of14-4]MCG7489004.1 LysE family translocator [Vibrio sp. Of14-4]